MRTESVDPAASTTTSKDPSAAGKGSGITELVDACGRRESDWSFRNPTSVTDAETTTSPEASGKQPDGSVADDQDPLTWQ